MRYLEVLMLRMVTIVCKKEQEELTNKEMAEFLRQLRNRREIPIDEDEYYLLEAIAERLDENDLQLKRKVRETLSVYAEEQCFTEKEAIVNLIESGLKNVYSNTLF